MISFISSFESINVVIFDQKMFLWIAAYVTDAAAINPNGIKMLLATGLSTFTFKGKPLFSNGSRSPWRNPPDCTILDNWVLDKFILANELFAKALQSFETFVLVNNN